MAGPVITILLSALFLGEHLMEGMSGCIDGDYFYGI